jgi:hypothetical protein
LHPPRNRPSCAARAEQRDPAALQRRRLFERAHRARAVRVIAREPPVAVIDRVHCADFARGFIECIEMGHDGLLVRHRDIQSANAQRTHRIDRAGNVLDAEADERIVQAEHPICGVVHFDIECERLARKRAAKSWNRMGHGYFMFSGD